MPVLKHNSKQSGVALITAILIVAVISVSAVYLIDSGYTVMRKTQQRIDNEQFLQLAESVEKYGLDLLYRDNFFDYFTDQEERFGTDFTESFDAVETNPLGYDPHNDSLFEPWAKPRTPEFIKSDLKEDFAQHNVLYITDLNRFFNINNLHFANSVVPEIKQTFNYNVTIFKELIRQINDDNFDIDPDEITNEIIDWLDHDDDSRNVILFTEDDVYRRADSEYRPANRPISSIGELENVLGMTPELMSKLSKYVVALPVYMDRFAPYKQAFSPAKQGAQGFDGQNAPALTKLNVNTTSPELLAGLFAIYNNQNAVGLFIQDQGKFQNNTTRLEAKDFAQTYASTVPIPPGAPPSQVSDIEENIRRVASVYSQFFLIESFFQKTNGVSFNLESLVYLDFNNGPDTRPIVVQRTYDWLPLQDLKNPNDEESS